MNFSTGEDDDYATHSAEQHRTDQLNLTALKLFAAPLDLAKLRKYDKSECWHALSNVDASLSSLSPSSPLGQALRQTAAKQASSSTDASWPSIDPTSLDMAIRNRSEPTLLLVPRLVIGDKALQRSGLGAGETTGGGGGGGNDSSVWLGDFEQWRFTRSGFIESAFFANVCLGVDTSAGVQLELSVTTPSSSSPLSSTTVLRRRGYVVRLVRRDKDQSQSQQQQHQQWRFTRFGQIAAADSQANMMLTSVELLRRELDRLSKPPSSNNDNNNNSISTSSTTHSYMLSVFDKATASYKSMSESSGGDASSGATLILMEELGNNSNTSTNSQVVGELQLALPQLALAQRWAIKQEVARTIGQWRHSVLSTSEWHRMALTWPVDEREQLIEKLSWPVCGCLIAGAPPLVTGVAGEQDDSAAAVARTRLRVLRNGSLNSDAANAHTICRQDPKTLVKEFVHCTKLTYRQFEFNA